MKYTHLTQEERLDIFVWLREGKSMREVAKRLSRSVGTVSREIKRNKARGKSYDPLYAHRKSVRRCSEGNSTPNKVGRNVCLKRIVEEKLRDEKWSPDNVSGRLKRELKVIVSTQTIYNYIYKERPERRKYLKYKKGYRRRGIPETRGSVKPTRSIEERPKSVMRRNRYGHREIDTVRGKKPGGGGLLTITERKSRYCEVQRLETRKSNEVKVKTLVALMKYDRKKLLTITRDNGKEFALFTELEEELQIKCYAAHTYASHERGTNEHANGMIRVFYPKGTDFTKISDNEVLDMQRKLNSKPRKILGYKTPQELLLGLNLSFFKGVAL